ncbi:hypothetical protein I2I11_05380 [Pontibacter sp. 172403-2]|uniref:hypothetical protein n=1 Tax=Pontibacter rufus TaxID=2791028 RepID=UPI0018AFCE3A|nr:hypothetical protein [Pontibacter sp. 172403-2]MBF9252711.1 hypothetical protein [Pontibacter sp. 172403-2]
MINPVLTYLHDFYGDGRFYDLTPLINQNLPGISEAAIQNLHLEGLIDIEEPSVFEDTGDTGHRHPIYGRLTETGIYYMEGNRKIAAVIRAIENQAVLHILYRDEKGHEEKVTLSPYVYGKDPEERASVWGAVSGSDKKHRRFLLDQITITEGPTGTFKIDKEMMLSQPRDIDVIAQVPY